MISIFILSKRVNYWKDLFISIGRTMKKLFSGIASYSNSAPKQNVIKHQRFSLFDLWTKRLLCANYIPKYYTTITSKVYFVFFINF